MKLFLSALSVSVLILILSLVALGALFGYQNNQEINRLTNNDLSISLDKARESNNKKEKYINELLEKITNLKIQLSNIENNDGDLPNKDLENLLSEKDSEISRLKEEIKEMKECDCKEPEPIITKVKWRKKPKLEYPSEAEDIEGQCIATFDVSQKGTPTSIDIKCNNDIFYPAAMKAISNSRVEPSTENGLYINKTNKNITVKLSFNFDSKI